MRTYWLMLGATAALTLGLVCFVSYLMSKPDSSVQPKIAQHTQKQNADRVITAKKPVSGTPIPAPIDKPAIFKPVPTVSTVNKDRPKHTQPAANLRRTTPQRLGKTGNSKVPEVPQ